MNRRSLQAMGNMAGFTLVEVLIAVTVLSIGILGISKLMLSTIKSNDDAGMRTRATLYANVILDNMRANLTDAKLGSGSTYNVSSIMSYTGTAGCVSSACTASAIASSDLANWKALLVRSLPGYATGDVGDASITVANTSAPIFTTATVTVKWNNTRAVAAFEGGTCASSSNNNCVGSVTLATVLQ